MVPQHFRSRDQLIAAVLTKLALIALGGALGALGRYGVQAGVHRLTGDAFPWGTMVVNVLGCALIGVLGGMFLTEHSPIREEYRAFLFIGLLGAFTTFSTFGWETMELINDGAWGRAVLNVVLSNVAGLGAVWIGLRTFEHFTRG